MTVVLQREVVIVEACRTPSGRRTGGLSAMHPSLLLGVTQRAVLERAAVDPEVVDQIVGGCIGQIGAQSANVTRNAWLTAGLPLSVPATTIDSQCGSSQQAAAIASSLIASGAIDVAIACGVENMSMIPIGAATKSGPGRALTRAYFAQYEFLTQFQGAERIAEQWGLTRSELDAYGLESQQRSNRAWDEGRFDAEVVPVDAPVMAEDGKPSDRTIRISRDEGLRHTSLEALAALRPVVAEDGYHTAGTSSQIADQSSAVLLMSGERAGRLGLRPRARVVDHCLVGSDPVLMLTGPIPATQRMLERNDLTVDDIDVFEVNEAFAAVVLAWARELKPDMNRVNPNGGAISIGHALGSTGTRLITTALHELERTSGRYGLITMCCGGGLGTGTLIERLPDGRA
jgi:acetyl-CoA C-acetyltransferase